MILFIFKRKTRTRQHPRTPCKYAKMSRRGFDGAIKAWRRKLYEFSGDKYVFTRILNSVKKCLCYYLF